MTHNYSSKPEFNVADNAIDRTKVAAIKQGGDDLIHLIEVHVAEGPRRSVALRHLETALMYAVKAVHYPGE